MEDAYMKRSVDPLVKAYIESMGAVLIEGPKWCGKTRTSKEFSKSALYIKDPNQIEALKLAAENGTLRFLEGDTPRLIDEWQDVPEIWNSVRFEVDRRGQNGQFILTGSSVPPNEPTRHSGAGRIGRIRMRPMSLAESGESDSTISLRGLFQKDYKVDGFSKLTVDSLALAISRGGWPASIKT
ncbi:MAG: AAA family ATPase, partial [Candidatus Methanoplasma sp.]|nr:AAA family ATPase [Candidatus Methanoplasma sp.]